MLTARRQAIGGAGTCTPLDCGLVGLLLSSIPLSPAGFPQYGWKVGISAGAFPNRCRAYVPSFGVAVIVISTNAIERYERESTNMEQRPQRLETFTDGLPKSASS